MPPIIEGPPEAGEARPPLRTRLGWFIALWIAGAISVAAAAYTLRALIL
ncbi:MAG: DUF2474 domain-containing protein [Alphaproteobacteria bacterium]|nr:DUF2474 domain-containing protein [Alphaproteobacteria bacterium]